MSILTRLLIENPKTIKKACQSAFDGPQDDYDVAGVLCAPNSLASLLAVVRQSKKYHEDRFLEEIEILSVEDNEEMGLMRVPDEIVTSLSKMNEKELSKIALSWKKTDLFFKRAGDDVTAYHLEIILRSMCKASKEAIKTKKQVFVCCDP